MSQSTVNQLIAGIGGAHVAAFFIVLARVTPLFVIAPMFSSKMIPKRSTRHRRSRACRGAHAGRLAWCRTSRRTPLAIAGLIVQSMLVGFGFAFVVATVFAALNQAGTIIDGIAGFSFGGPGRPDQRHPSRACSPTSTTSSGSSSSSRSAAMPGCSAGSRGRSRSSRSRRARRSTRSSAPRRLRSVRSSSARSNSPRRRCSR